MRLVWLSNPLMKIGLGFLIVNFLPRLFPMFNNILYYGIIGKVCLVLGLGCILFVMFKDKFFS